MRACLLVILAAGCGNDAWLSQTKILVDGYNATSDACRTDVCPHNENTDLTIFDGATYLVHRTAESQVLGPNSSLRVYRSDDHGKTFDLLAVIPEDTLEMLCKAFCWCNKHGAGSKHGAGTGAGEKIIRRVPRGTLA